MSEKLRESLGVYRLEDRVLFDAAIAAAVETADALEEAAADVDAADDVADEMEEAEVEAEAEIFEEVILPVEVGTVEIEVIPEETATVPVSFNMNTDVTLSTRRELVVINSSVADAQQIVDALQPHQDVLFSDCDPDSINAYLDEHSDTTYDAIHLITHGNEGFFTLNGEIISNDNFDADAWSAVGEHLSQDADILIYGCDLAGNEAGAALCARIADATGADVAASSDATGFSGDWDLEYTTGDVETEEIAVSGYEHNLTAFQVTVSEGAGEGSFYWAIQQANSNVGADEIVFDSVLDGTAIKPNADATAVITEDVTISGNGIGQTILGDASSEYLIFEVGADAEVTVTDLTIQYGRGMKGGTTDAYYDNGGAIINAGTLNLDGVEFIENDGAVYSTGDLNITDVSFDDSSSVQVEGGALTIENSLFNGSSLGLNTAEDSFILGTTFYGSSTAAIDHAGTGSLNVINSTIANGGITSAGNVTLVNTIATCELSGSGTYTLYSSVYGSATATVTADSASAVKAYADVFGTNVLADNGGYVWSLKAETMPEGGVSVTLYRDSAGVLTGAVFGTVTLGTTAGSTGAELDADARGYLLNGTHLGAIASNYYVAWSGDNYYATVNEGVADVIANSLGTLHLVGGRILITETISISGMLTIKGQGMDVTILDGGNTFDADGASLNTGIRIMNIASGSSVIIDGMTFMHGKGEYLEGDAQFSSYTKGGGGAIYNWGTLVITNAAFRENYSATYGGAIATVSSASSLTVTNAEFTDNHAVTGGGAIHQGQDVSSYTGAVLLTNVLLERNSTDGTGGAFHQGGDATKAAKQNVFTNVTAQYNTSVGAGAVIHSSNGSWKFTDSTFMNNTASGNGGVINITKGSTMFEECVIVSNRGAGGGVICSAANAQNNVFLNTTIYNNQAVTGSGGVGSLGNGCAPVFYNCVIVGNSAKMAGGVIYAGNYSGNIYFISSVVTNNKAGTSGGAVYTTMTGSNKTQNIYLVNSIVSGNRGSGDIYGTVNVANNRVTYVYAYNSVYGTVKFSADMPDVEELVTDSASTQTSDLSGIFANNAAYTFDEATGKINFTFAEESTVIGKGIYIYHSEDWKSIAFATTSTATEPTYVRGTSGATTVASRDYLGYTITGAPSQGPYHITGAERASLHVTTATDVVDDTDGLISFREALLYAQADSDGVLKVDGKYTITFDSSITAITLDAELGEIFLTGCFTPIVIDGSVGEDGLTNVTIKPGATQRLFNIINAVDLTFYHTTISGNGSLAGDTSTSIGGIILVSATGTTITFDNAVMRDGMAIYGGGIYSKVGNFTLNILNGSKILSNKTDTKTGREAGAFYINGSNNILTVKDSILQKNTSRDWAGIANIYNTTVTFENVVIEGTHGGSQGSTFVFQGSSKVTMKNVSILNNTGGIYGQISLKGTATLYMENCSVLGNTGAGSGGAVIDVGGGTTLVMVNCTVAGTYSNGSIYMDGGEACVVNSIVMVTATNSNNAFVGNANNFKKLTLINSLYSSSPGHAMNALSANNHMVMPASVFSDGKNQKLTVTDYTAADADLRAAINADVYTLTPDNPSYASVAGTQVAYNSTTNTPFYFVHSSGNWYNAKTGELATAVEESWIITKDQLGNTVSGRTAGAVSVSYDGSVIENITDMVVNTAEDVINPFDGKLSLREALSYAEAGDTITFSSEVFTAENHTILLDSELGDWIINKNLTFEGKVLQADGSAVNMILRVPVTYAESVEKSCDPTTNRLFYIASYAAVTFNDMELYGGKVSGRGGTIYVYNGQLIMNNVIAGESYASEYGGVIAIFDPNQTWTKDVRLEANHCQIVNGTSRTGGGGVAISTDSTNSFWYAEFVDVLFSGNSALGVNNNTGGGAIYVNAGSGATRGSYLYVDSCTFRGNLTASTSKHGAAIYCYGDKHSNDYSLIYSTIVNSTFVENKTSASTIFISRFAQMDLINNTIVNNSTTNAIYLTNNLSSSYGPTLNSLNNIILGQVTAGGFGSNKEPVFNAKYTIFDSAPTGLSVTYTDGVDGNKIGGENITYDALFTGEWTDIDGRVAQTLKINRAGYAAAPGSGVLSAATVWSNHSTDYSTYTQKLYYSVDGTNWLNFSDGTAADLSADSRAEIFTSDQVGNDRKADPAAFNVGAYSSAINYANLIVTGLDDSTDPDIVTFAEAWTFAKNVLSDAAAAGRTLTIQFDESFFNASAADTTIIVETALDFKSEDYNLISIAGNGYVTLKGATGVTSIFTVSGDNVDLSISNVTFDATGIANISGDNAEVNLNNVKLDGSSKPLTVSGSNAVIDASKVTVSAGATADFSGVDSGLTLTDLAITETATVLLGSAALTGTTAVNGNLNISGNVTNSGTFDASIGSVTYSGGDQTVLAGTYNNLTFSTGDTAATKTLAGNVSVTGKFTANGTSESAYLIIDGGGNTISVESAEVSNTHWQNITAGSLTISGSGNTAADSGVSGLTIEIDASAVQITSTTALTFGGTLSESTVTGTVTVRGTAIAGSFAFADGDTVPDVSDSGVTDYAVAFTATNSIYKVADTTAKVTVNALQVDLSGLANQVQDKVYDGSTAATVDQLSINNGAFTVSGSGTFNDANAGTDKTVTFRDLVIVAADGIDLTNYTFLYNGAAVTVVNGKITTGLTAKADISVREVTVSFDNSKFVKTYDGTTALTFDNSAYTLTNVVAGETVTLTVSNAAFDSYKAADSVGVTLSGLALSGNTAANYVLVDAEGNTLTQVDDLTGTINKAALTVTVSGTTDGASVEYGTLGKDSLSATTSALASTDKLESAIAITASEGLSTAGYYNAGTHSVTTAYKILNGTEDVTDCYDVTVEGVKTFTVTPKALTIDSAGSKVYDGVAEIGTGAVTLGGVVSGDQVSGTLATTALTDSVVGTYTIDGKNVTLSGTDSGNYVLPDTVNVSITARALTIEAVADHTYGDNAAVTVSDLASGQSGSGNFITSAGESVSGFYNAGTHTVTGLGEYRITDSAGNDVTDNYSITIADGLSFTVAQKMLNAGTLTAQTKVYDKTDSVSASVAYTDSVTGDVLSLSGTLKTPSVNAGNYNVDATGLSISGASAANFAVSGTIAVTINKRDVEITSIAGLYGESVITTVQGDSAFVGEDVFTGMIGSDLGLSADGEYVAGTHTVNGIGTLTVNDGNNGGNYNIILGSAFTTFTIDKRGIIITADAVTTNGNGNESAPAPKLTYTVSGDGLFGTDVFYGSLACPSLDLTQDGSYAITIGSLKVIDSTGVESANYEITFVPAKVTVTNVVQPVEESSSMHAGMSPAFNNPGLSSVIYSIASGTSSTEFQNEATIGMFLSTTASPRNVDPGRNVDAIGGLYVNDTHSAAHIDIMGEIRRDSENTAILERARAAGDVLFDGAMDQGEDDLRKRMIEIPVQIDSFAMFDSFSVEMADADTDLQWSDEVTGSLPEEVFVENRVEETDDMAGVEHIQFTMLLHHALPCRDELDETIDALCVI